MAVVIGLVGQQIVRLNRNQAQKGEVEAIVTRGGGVLRDPHGRIVKAVFPTEQRRNLRDTDIREFPISKLQSVSSFDLSQSQVTDASVAALGQLRGLRMLDLTGTRISKNGLAKLTNLLPECTITADPPK